MNATATRKIAFAALAAPALAAVAIGLAGTAEARPGPSGSGPALETVDQLREQGSTVVVNKDGDAPLDQCTVTAVRSDRHRHHGGPQSETYNTVYVDAYCR